MNFEKEQLKNLLQRIKEDDFRMSDQEGLSVYIKEMLKYLGDLDMVLRDDLIFEALYHWIWEYKYLSKIQIRELTWTLMDEHHMFEKIQLRDEDSVFTRSFSVLTLSLILRLHAVQPCLDMTLFDSVKKALLRYIALESDLRGYVMDQGWAHSVAHSADALGALAQSQECDETTHEEVLEAIRHMVFNGRFALCHKEDDRMAKVVYLIHKTQRISSNRLIQWLEKLCGDCDFAQSPESYISSVNFRNLVRSLYFKIKFHEGDSMIIQTLLHCEKLLHPSFHT